MKADIVLKRYINTLPTLTQLPTGEDDDEHTNNIRYRRSEKICWRFQQTFKDLEEWTSNAIQIETWKDHFLKEYPKIFNGSSENEEEMNINIDTTMKTKPPIDRGKLKKSC